MSGVFNPQGPIATQERDLIITAVLIMLVVAIPMLITLFTFAWKYRAGNKNAKRDPERTGHFFGQIIWWAIPAVVIVTLGILNWKTTHALDPAKSIASTNPQLTIDVVALPWKWLFIYPAQGIATVNLIEFPVNTSINFQLTADAPMSSFWIPQLGSQEYAMDGMVNQLNLMATTQGQFPGRDTEINGDGYSGMTFTADSVSQSDFDAWVASVQQSSSSLTMDAYNALSAPSENNPPAYYASVANGLYGTILMKYMAPMESSSMMQMMNATSNMEQNASQTMPGMEM